jgi:hypothetical protein
MQCTSATARRLNSAEQRSLNPPHAVDLLREHVMRRMITALGLIDEGLLLDRNEE